MTDDHVSYMKDKGDCGCGCGAWGTLKKPNRAGIRCVSHQCKCNSCRGKINRTKGDRKAAVARKQLGAMGANSRHEEHWGGALRIEAKAGAQVGPILTRYLAAKNQSEAARAIGDNRPFVMAAMPDKGPGLLVIELDELAQIVAALLENWGEVA
jgi:hypothetical protein